MFKAIQLKVLDHYQIYIFQMYSSEYRVKHLLFQCHDFLDICERKNYFTKLFASGPSIVVTLITQRRFIILKLKHVHATSLQYMYFCTICLHL